jgi:putative spermidine/putrescine transport system permease protein
MMVPLLTGFVARNYSWVGLLTAIGSHRTPLSPLGELLDSRAGIVTVMAVVFVPFVYFIVSEAASHLSPPLYEASRTLGATDARAFFVITLPLLLPATLLAFALSTILGLGYFVTPHLIGGGNFPFVANGVLSRLDLGDAQGAALLGLYLLATVFILAGLVAIVRAWWLRRHEPLTKTPHYVRTK